MRGPTPLNALIVTNFTTVGNPEGNLLGLGRQVAEKLADSVSATRLAKEMRQRKWRYPALRVGSDR